MTVHQVAPGESLYAIARQHGFATWLALYHHPDNAALRRRRPNPHVLHPGDEVVIPGPCPGGAPVALDQVTVVVRRRRGWQPLRVRLTDARGGVLASQPFELTCGALELKGKTDPEGLLQVELPADAREVQVEVGGLRLELRVGALNPLDADTPDGGVSGCQQRLNNLGHHAGPVDGVAGPHLEEALRRFQRAEGLEVTGRLDDASRRALARRHGS